MCGLAGVVARSAVDEHLLRRMADALSHRGPDDHGLWVDSEAGVGLGHRRLAIVDLSPAGHQPMASRDGRWVIAYNGEIYNHEALRRELEEGGGGPPAQGEAWRGHSDTETLVECIAAWGWERAVEKCAGMFAIALWDRQERRLHLIRDRFGEKPLYYGWIGGDFVFASELKALRLHPAFDNAVSRRAVGLFVRLGYVPAPLSIHEEIYKLEPGCALSATAVELRGRRGGDGPPEELVSHYWSYQEVLASGLARPIADEVEALDRLEAVLSEAVRGQAMADVPVGAFLSGGIDSSTVVALLQQHSRVRTFTIGFEDAVYDEAPYARAVAQHLGTEHHEAVVTAREAQEVIPLLPRIYDEPFADSSQIPTYLVSRYARGEVTVALTGDGGDELFGGYNRYIGPAYVWSRLNRWPTAVRRVVAGTLGLVPAEAWNSAADLLRRRSRHAEYGLKIRSSLRTMGSARSVDDLHDSLIDVWHREPSPAGSDDREIAALGRCGLEGVPDAVRMMYRDAVTYLPGDILCKVDRAGMAVSLETRVPMLDHRVAELAARIPVEFSISGGTGKRMLRNLLYRHVPRELFERPKTGFGIPVGDWLRGPLRPWAEELLDESRLRQGGYLDPAPVRRRWEDHLSGRRESTGALWHVLMFQAWLTEGRPENRIAA